MSSSVIPNVGEKVYWVLVQARNTATGQVKKLHWKDLPWPVRTKWDWYFKYRAALLQVQNPRWQVHMHWGDAVPSTEQLLTHRRNVVTAKKGRLTQAINAVEKAKEEWSSLFPIEQDPAYKRAQQEIDRRRRELSEAINRWHELVEQEVANA